MSWLHNKHPIVINTDMAAHVGLNEAIILQQLNYWLVNTASGVEHAGVRWVYNTLEQWQEQFPFWSIDTIKRAFASLKKQELILVAKLAKAKHDRTNYYSVNHAKLDEMYAATRMNPHQCKMPSSNSANCTDGTGQSAPMEQGNLPPSNGAICTVLHTEITTETTPENLPGGVPAAPASQPPVIEGVVLPVEPRVNIPADMPGPKDPTCKTYMAWANYAMAYRSRYQAWPVWNRKVAGQVAQLVERLGIEVAHHVAAFYVKVNDARLIADCHSLGKLLLNAEAFHTQWRTNRQVNGTTARQQEQMQANLNAGLDAAEQILQERGGELKDNEFMV